MARPIVGIAITGDKVIDKMFAELPAKLQRKAIAPEIRAAVKEDVLPDIRKLAPVDTGLLRKLLTVRVATAKGGKRLPRGTLGYAVVVRHGKTEGRWTRSVIARFLEFAERFEKHRFMRKGLYENRKRVRDRIRKAIAANVRRIAAETAAKTAIK